MWSLLFFAVGSLAACSLDVSNTSCLASTSSECVDTCTLYDGRAGCLAAGCTYNLGCSSNATSACRSYNSTQCAADPKCTYKTVPCAFGMKCSSATFSSLCSSSPSDTAATCAAQGSSCQWAPACEESNKCRVNKDQTACTGTADCYWVTGVITTNNYSKPASGCGLCFKNPQFNNENSYLSYLQYVGKTCMTLVGIVTYSSIAPAATGCTGGIVYQNPGFLTCTNTTPAPSSAQELSASLALFMALCLLA